MLFEGKRHPESGTLLEVGVQDMDVPDKVRQGRQE